MTIFNPFNSLMETRKYPHAHSHRTTFAGKLKDSFKVFYGTRALNREDQLGIFDFLTLGLHHGVNKLMFAVGKNLNPLAFVLLYAVWNIPRILFAALCTLIFSPVTYLAHTLFSKEGEPLRRGVLSYKLDNADYLIHIHHSVLPDASKHKNSFIFLCRKDELYWVNNNGVAQRIEINDREGFRKALDIERVSAVTAVFSVSKLHNKEELNRFLATPPASQSETFGEFLESRDLDLEDIQASSIEVNAQNAQKLNLSLGQKRMDSITNKDTPLMLQRIPVNLSDAKDVCFFNQLRKLNVGRIQSVIEEDASLQTQFN